MSKKKSNNNPTLTDRKSIINRINRLVGQVEGVKKMVEEERSCEDVLIQCLAISKASKAIANCILRNHFNHCIVEKLKNGEYEILEDIVKLIERVE